MAPSRVRNHYKSDRATTKDTIDADHVIPSLTELVTQVLEQAADLAGIAVIPVSRNDIEQSLQWAGHLQQLEALSDLYSDYARIDLLISSAIRWAQVRAGLVGIALVGLLPVGTHFILTRFDTSAVVWVLGLFLAGLTGLAALATWFIEMDRRNQLSKLFLKYE